jgi:hypothetical protein
MYSKHPYSSIQENQTHAGYRIYREIEDGKPPATRPDNLSHYMRKLWDHLELCWNIEAGKRPSAADAVNFLEENGRYIAQPLSDDLDVPGLSHLREETIMDLTTRVKNVSEEPISSGLYWSIWKGKLDEDQMVSNQLLPITYLTMDIGFYQASSI